MEWQKTKNCQNNPDNTTKLEYQRSMVLVQKTDSETE